MCFDLFKLLELELCLREGEEWFIQTQFSFETFFLLFFRLNYIFLFPVILSNRSFLVFLQLFPIPNQA